MIHLHCSLGLILALLMGCADTLAGTQADGGSTSDAVMDVTADIPTDTPTDAVTDTVTAAHRVPCGSTTCDLATEVCCIPRGASVVQCVPATAGCDGPTLGCWAPEDCPAGEMCCLTGTPGGGVLGAQCQTSCQWGTNFTACHSSADCTHAVHHQCCPFGDAWGSPARICAYPISSPCN